MVIFTGCSLLPRMQRPAVNDPRKTCRCEPYLRYYGRRVDKPDFHKTLTMDVKTSFFVGKPVGGRDSWRTVTVVGSPEGYELFLDGVLIYRVPREVPISWRRLVQNDWKLAGDLDFSPRRPLGIFISHASASIRLAELTPGRNP